ncbi:hypothetical protein GBA52_003634 [Prunus armeniaca]|nr:hypothetical protein GBA52_003634 [Prunus armeniaca]
MEIAIHEESSSTTVSVLIMKIASLLFHGKSHEIKSSFGAPLFKQLDGGRFISGSNLSSLPRPHSDRLWSCRCQKGSGTQVHFHIVSEGFFVYNVRACGKDSRLQLYITYGDRPVFSRESFMLSENLVFHLYIQPKSVPERALKQVECTKRTNEVIAASELLGKSTWDISFRLRNGKPFSCYMNPIFSHMGN